MNDRLETRRNKVRIRTEPGFENGKLRACRGLIPEIRNATRLARGSDGRAAHAWVGANASRAAIAGIRPMMIRDSLAGEVPRT
jgi:hypothetical protein